MSASRDAAADLALLKTLVGQLSSPLTNDGVKAVQNSLDQLCGLISVVPSLKKSYRTAGGIPILATLLNCGEEQLAFSAGKLVQIIADNHDNREACRESGMISALLTNVQCGKKYSPATTATAALAALIVENNSNRDAIVRHGAIPVLVKLLSAGPYQEITWYAANALRELCLDSQSCREEVSQLGAVRTLTGLLDVGLDQPAGAAAVGVCLSLALTDSLRLSLHDAGRRCWTLVDAYKSIEEGGEGARPGARLQAMLLIALLFAEAKVGNRAAGKLLNRLNICGHVVRTLQAAHGAPDHSYLGVRWTVQECVTYLRWLTDNEDFTDRLSQLGAPGVLAEVVRTGSGGASPLLDACVSMVHLGAREAMATTVREAKAAEDALRAAGEMMFRSAAPGFMCPCDCSAQEAQSESAEEDRREREQRERERAQQRERGGSGVGKAGVSSFDRLSGSAPPVAQGGGDAGGGGAGRASGGGPPRAVARQATSDSEVQTE